MRLAVLASLNGTNAQAIVEASRAGALDAEVAVIVTNRTDAGVIARGRALGIPVEVIPSKGVTDRTMYDSMVLAVLERYEVDTVALAGWMRILSETFIDSYPGRILNLHPALLPSFPGGTGIADAFGYGVKVAGCTVHVVDPTLDGGPVVIQAAVPVCPCTPDAPGDPCPQDTLKALEARIHRMEHLIFPQALQWLAEGRIDVEGRRTSLAPSASPVERRSIVDGCLVCPPLETPVQPEVPKGI